MLYHNGQATRTTFFTSYCKGASDDRNLHTSWGSKHTSGRQKSTIARTWRTVARVWQWWPTTQQSNFPHAVNQNDDGKQARIARSDSNEHIFNVVLWEKQQQFYFCCCKRQSYCAELEMTISQPSWDVRTQQSNLYMLLTAMMMTTCPPFYVVLQGATIPKDGWLWQRRICQATTNLTFTLHCRSKQQSQNDDFINVMIMPYVVLQEATTTATTVDCNKSARLHNDNKLFSSMWMNHIYNYEGERRQQWDWSWCHDNNVDDTTIILLYMLYCKEWQQ